MIYTLTLNPSVDYSVRLWGELETGALNRSVGDTLLAGGKGVNCAIVLHRLGQEVTALGFLGGATGDIVRDALYNEGVICAMDSLSASQTRINVKVQGAKHKVTEINGKGPRITEAELSALRKRIQKIGQGDILIISGSIPDGVPEDIYYEFMKTVTDAGAMTVLDTPEDSMLDALELRPLLVKPNIDELSHIFGKEKISGEEEIAEYAAELCSRGAQYALISMGPDGALMASSDGSVYTVPAVPVKVKSTVGSGDSMVAGFVSAFVDSGDAVGALRMGNACGSATAGCEHLTPRGDAEELYEVSKGTVRCLRKGAPELAKL